MKDFMQHLNNKEQIDEDQRSGRILVSDYGDTVTIKVGPGKSIDISKKSIKNLIQMLKAL